jgi:hypothetical protein
MAYIEGPKFTGTVAVDLTAQQDDLVDVEPGGLAGARGADEALLKKVLTEYATAVPNHGDEAEIHPAVYKRIVDAGPKIAALEVAIVQLEKLLEVARESLTRLINNREEDISAIASQAEKKAEKLKRPDLLAHFEHGIGYKSRNADKGVETRRRNEEEKKQAAASAAPATAAGGAQPAGGTKTP